MQRTGQVTVLRSGEMTRLSLGFFIVALLQVPASDRAAIARYQAAIKSGSIEAAFTELRSLGATLPRVLESLSDSEFKQLERDLPGAVVNREEVLVVAPEADYFVNLATSRGDAADRRFFATFKMVYPDNTWPAYFVQQTDYSGCTAFGSGKLVEAYRLWSDFQKAFPNRYGAAVRNELARVSNELTQSTCACGDAPSIRSELQRFIREFPTSSIRARVEERLKALEAGKSDIRLGCISG